MSATRYPCPFCHAPSTPFLEGRPDYEYGIAQRLDYHRCIECGLVFAAPIPEDQIGSFYASYSTHAPAKGGPSFLTRAARTRALREFESCVPVGRDARVLDYGCGNGTFLAELRDAGFGQLTGYDFDPQARQAARAVGACVIDERSALAERGPFDVITLNHVIEHMAHPAREVGWLASMLSPGGRLLVRTPNGRSILSGVLGAAWRGWETPRHLHVFSPRATTAFAAMPELAALKLGRLFTSQAMFLGIFHESLRGSFWRSPPGRLLRHGAALAVYPVLTGVNRFSEVGEELVFVLKRR